MFYYTFWDLFVASPSGKLEGRWDLMDAQDLCLLEAPDVLWPEDFDPQRHAEVCHFLGDVES